MSSATAPPGGPSNPLAEGGLEHFVRIGAIPTVILQGVRLHAITERQCVDVIMNAIGQRQGGSVVTMNLDHLRRFGNEGDYAACCRSATIVTADGMPLIWASRLQRTPLPERVTGSNLIWSLTAAAARQRKSIFLIGGAPGVARRTADTLLNRFPGIRIAGVSSEIIDPKRGRGLKRLSERLESSAPDIVYVGLGSPKQEAVIHQLRDTLPNSWWMGVGIAFSFVSGEIRRAPVWMQSSGLEWVHRLMQEPTRLARRYLVAGLPFAATLLCGSALLGLRKADPRDPQPADDFSCL
jgi:N-acetylglucosaminyldiphosphoundecaprenol N-acetyl-beta-D-mannosaminyltransferase